MTALEERCGVLPDGTAFLMRVPPAWNGVLIRDMDFASAADVDAGGLDEELRASTGATGGSADRYRDMLRRGYAVAGTARHPMDFFQYDPVHEIALLDEVLHRFETAFEVPSRVIQYGGSGGGHVSQAVAEDFADRIDAAIAFDAQTPVWLMNTQLDMWFVLKTLIGSQAVATGMVDLDDLHVVGLPNAGLRRVGDTIAYLLDSSIENAWRTAIDAAQRTPEGRARIALAAAIGQWPVWGSGLHTKPSLDDVSGLQHSMYHLVHQEAANAGGAGRILFENAAHGQQLSWNTGIDYAALFENGAELHKRAVHALYGAAGLELPADLQRLSTAPRVEASDFALEFWSAPGRNVAGNPSIPLLRVQGLGDAVVPYSLAQGYQQLACANGNEHLFRAVFIDADGHLAANTAESAVAIEMVLRRLDTGNWGDTDPTTLNEVAAALGAGSGARFASPHECELNVVEYNRIWVPET